MRVKVPRSPDLDPIIANYRDKLKDPWIASVESVIPKLNTVDAWHNPMATHLQKAAVKVAERVAFKFIFKTARQIPSHAPDIMAEAHYVATLCAEKYAEHNQVDPLVFEKLVAVSTKRACIQYMISIQAVHVPLTSFNEGISKLLGFEEGKVTMCNIDGMELAKEKRTYNEEEANAVLDRLFSDLSEEDQVIARMRHEGYILTDIAAEVGMSKSNVAKRIKKIQSELI